MSPINVRRRLRPKGLGGFTLVEVMMATLITAIVFAGVLSAYIFLGRGLVRQGNEEAMESRSRTTLFYFTQDVSAATAVTAYTASQLVISTPSAIVTYTYNAAPGSPGIAPSGTLVRTQIPANLSIPTSLLTNLSTFAFNYLTISGTAASSAATVKQIQLSYTAVIGSSVGGAQAQITVVSPRVIMKNKPSLQ